MKRILIVGAGGQIGSELTTYLRKIYGDANVIATDVRECPALAEQGPFEVLDALDITAMASIVSRYRIDTIFNLVALLSAVGEKNPQLAWKINIGALTNSLEVARDRKCAVFTPSSIGAFGPSSPKDKTPQDTVMRPTTMYGVCKVTGELMGDYYHTRFGVDARSVRFPGLISNVTLPGGGTTDYAVEIYYEAVKSGRFTCPIPADVYMDMIYMPDALRACGASGGAGASGACGAAAAVPGLVEACPGPYDVVVSNPPYVPESERGSLRRNVVGYEPAEALFVPDDDPLRFYRAIARAARGMLRSGGALCFEIHEAFGGEMLRLGDALGYRCCELFRDFRDRPRTVRFRQP